MGERSSVARDSGRDRAIDEDLSGGNGVSMLRPLKVGQAVGRLGSVPVDSRYRHVHACGR